MKKKSKNCSECNNAQRMEMVHFIDYCKKNNVCNVDINHEIKQVFIYDDKNKLVSTLRIARSIQHPFTVAELFNKNTQVGEKVFFVKENGIGNKNWLYYLTHVATL